MSQLPPLNGLRAFETAGRCLNFRAAADELGVTQGAVAQQVRQLEAHLGLPLFERLPKGLAFTASGRSYHVSVTAAFEALRSATDQLKPEPGKVLVSVTPTFAAKWLIPNLPDFSAKHPDIDLRILATERVSSFQSDGIDLAVRQGKPPFGASLDAHMLFRQDVIAVAAPSLLDGQGVTAGKEAISSLPKLHDTHDLWPDFLRLLNVQDKGGRGLRLSQTSLAVDAALFGQGVALVSRFLVARDLAAKRLIQITPETMSGKQDFYLLAARKPKQNKSIDTVVAWLIESAQTVAS
ncbi:LysR family transcriptional regulator, glycine cleavage system transcriptional activator [Monaibacterium marinum]|uniref:LysR family transcriptional regulator, glycine cleavage system transcriptional activator n=1 Tax=Pontivivens marinum TaxID=1690039 RepID=A0A2C9CW49_9RHOB|nr:LysR substrate-binding domain-containing protein [Monaibacterium marinum]SOH95524.1 LysR family transcriptional regulator, glycine cleavage system transcriptional activator [Monaibacterium marinum]